MSLSALAAIRPEPVARWQSLVQQVWLRVDPTLLEHVRSSVAHLVGGPGRLTAAPRSELDRAGVALAEQMVLDVSRVDGALLAGLAPDYTEGRLADLVRALFVVEFTTRLEVTVPALLGEAPAHAAPGRPTDASLKQLLDEFQAAVVRGSALDPVTAELVRLHCARTHRCRICQTLRLGAARDAGVDDTMTAKIDFYERSDLPVRAKVALRLTDAVITCVGAPSDALRAQAHQTFTPTELASLLLEITKWSTQKIHVALGTDGAERLTLDDAGVALFDFAADGAVSGFRTS